MINRTETTRRHLDKIAVTRQFNLEYGNHFNLDDFQDLYEQVCDLSKFGYLEIDLENRSVYVTYYRNLNKEELAAEKAQALRNIKTLEDNILAQEDYLDTLKTQLDKLKESVV